MRLIFLCISAFALCPQAVAQKSFGHIQIKCPPGYVIHLDGGAKGTSSAEQGGLVLTDVQPGQHRLKISAENYQSQVDYLQLTEGQVLLHEVTLKPFVNRIRIQTIPVECSLSSDSSQLSATKSADLLTLSDIKPGEYGIKLSALDRVLSFGLSVKSNSQINIFANLLTGEVEIVDQRDILLPPGDWEALDDTRDENGQPILIFDHRTGIIFKLMRSGVFQMGMPGGDTKPRHLVELDSFYIGVTEVTQQQWKRILPFNSSGQIGDNLPVDRVSYDDCLLFMSTAGVGYRLPTEAEWEYACRAGTQSHFSYDPEFDSLEDVAWYDVNSGGMTHPVALKRPNAWGLYDMHGNVWEWCSDFYGKGYYEESPRKNPQGPKQPKGRVSQGSDLTVTHRVLRGGAWHSKKSYVRAGYREHYRPSIRGGSASHLVLGGGSAVGNFGLRVVYSQHPVSPPPTN